MAVLNDEQAMLRDMAREWAANESPFTAWRALRDAETGAGFDADACDDVALYDKEGLVMQPSQVVAFLAKRRALWINVQKEGKWYKKPLCNRK